MYKIRLMRRGINSRRLHRINSATDLVGESVIVSDGTDSTKADVEAVKLNSDDSVDMDLSNGDQLNLEPEEAQELVETGELTSEDAEVVVEDQEPEVASRRNARRNARKKCGEDTTDVETVVEEPEEFSVSRDVVGDDGEVESVVTTKVDAANSDDAVDKVKMIDSRRGRNCRHYRIRNSDSNESKDLKLGELARTNRYVRYKYPRQLEVEDYIMGAGIIGDKAFINFTRGGFDLDPSVVDDFISGKTVKSTDGAEVTLLSKSKTNSDTNVEETNCGMKEFKIQRNCGNGKRKVASVTAPSLEEAMDAVKAKDTEEGIQADGYAELAEEIAKVDPKINSDVEVEDPKPEDKPEDEERKENSFKGVSDYVKRAYGIKL